MISLLLESNALGYRSGAPEAQILGPVLFDTFAVSSTRKKPDIPPHFTRNRVE
jgi:hypothetical protein